MYYLDADKKKEFLNHFLLELAQEISQLIL